MNQQQRKALQLDINKHLIGPSEAQHLLGYATPISMTQHYNSGSLGYITIRQSDTRLIKMLFRADVIKLKESMTNKSIAREQAVKDAQRHTEERVAREKKFREDYEVREHARMLKQMGWVDELDQDNNNN